MTPTARWGALALLFAPLGVWALGLGDITLRSALNQRLEAEIELVSATAEELSNLRVSLASQATFERYGLEHPAYVGGIDFRVGTNNLGRSVILMTSRQAISEPFVTVLVEVAWSRGRLLREYTVLLDPPVMLPVPEAVQTIEPAATGAPDATQPAAAIDRPAPERVAQPTVRETPPSVQATPPLQTLNPTRTEAPVPTAGSYGPVKPAETLWSIADRYRPAGITMNQMLVAIYRANPQAFGGNMNTLHQGVTLRIPQLAELDATTAGDATQEALRQATLWQGGGDQPARLRLVTPASVEDIGIAPSGSAADAGTAAGTGAATVTAEIVELEGELNMVRDELDYNRRLLEIKDQQLQDLQTQLMAAQDAEVRLAERIAGAGLEPEPPTETGVDLESEVLFADEAEPLAETTPAITSPAVVAPPAAATRVVTTPSQPSWTSRALGWWTQIRGWLARTFSGLTDRLGGLTQSVSWLTGPILLIGLGVVALVGTAVLYLRRRQQDTGDVTGRWEADLDDEGDTLAATGHQRQPVESDEADYIVSEQQAETAAPLPELESLADLDPEPTLEPMLEPMLEPEPEPEVGDSPSISRTMTIGKSAAEETPPFDDTISSQTLINLEQADPVAEADFHMAYGLYDQAAELVEKALDVEPGRRDLKLKLLEVFFVWGNKDSFLETAKTLRGEIGSGPDSEWDKVVIMGKQICPDDPLFSGATASAGGVDVDLEAGDSPSLDMAFDVGDAPDADLSLAVSDTEEAAEEDGLGLGDQTLAGLETAVFDPPEARDDGTTPDLDADILAASQQSSTLAVPTSLADDALSLDLEDTVPGDSSALDTALESAGEEATEINLDDLGLDADDLLDLSDGEDATDVAADVLSSSGVSDVLSDVSAGSSATATGVALDLDDLASALGDDETAELPVAQIVGSDVLAGADTDLNVDTTSGQTGLLDPHTMTMTEVGTKLDLARAYVDMGDSDGARAILEEVVAEGDPGQKTEAQGIIDGL